MMLPLSSQLVYLLYGLSFFSLGLCLSIRSAAAPTALARRRILAIGVFGFLQALVAWSHLADLDQQELLSTEAKYGLSAASFLSLLYFGFACSGLHRYGLAVALTLPATAWLVSAIQHTDPVFLEVITRIVLGVPAALCAGYALATDATLRSASPRSDLVATTASAGFIVFAALQLFSSTGEFFPASVLNTTNFEEVVGISCVLFRACTMIIVTMAMIALMCSFEWEMRTRVDKELHENHRRLEQAQRIANIGSWEWNIQTHELFWSDQIFRIFGLTPQEFEASYPAFLQRVHADDRNLVEENVRRAVDERAPYSIDHRIVRPDGEIRVVHEQGEVEFSAAEKPVRMLGTVQDVTTLRSIETALQQSEETLSGILRISPEAIIVTDATMLVSLFSDGAKEIFGYTADEIVGRPLSLLLPERFRQRHETHVNNFVRSGVVSRKMGDRTEITGLRKNGE